MSQLVATPIPAHAGIGLRSQHYREILEEPPPVAWMEAHPENYFGEGGAPLRILERVRSQYPLSFHGVGLSLGATDPIDSTHLRKLKALLDRFQPTFVSEHLSWSSVDGRFFNDLLPLPYTEESLNHVCARIDEVQTELQRSILIENVTRYLTWRDSTIPEGEFMAEVV
ncbi:MAG TPA: hypothetical protein DDY39_16765, partial [Nitrospira sp.]|nr:hypothetical protein [Nitrospira sp.]